MTPTKEQLTEILDDSQGPKIRAAIWRGILLTSCINVAAVAWFNTDPKRREILITLLNDLPATIDNLQNLPPEQQLVLLLILIVMEGGLSAAMFSITYLPLLLNLRIQKQQK